MAYVSDANLTQFWGLSKQYIDARDGDFANWQKTADAGAVSCLPVPETTLEPKVEFLFTETPPASGDKSPSNPSIITGVSSVKVTRCGKNLCPPFESGSRYGITCTANGDGSFTLSGIATHDVGFSFPMSITLHPGTYTLSGCPAGGSLSTYYLAGTGGRRDVGSGYTFTAVAVQRFFVWFQILSGTDFSTPVIIRPQLELGSAATSFEKYEGADYVILLNGTYYGGSVDLSTGTMTVTHYGVVFDGVNVRATDHPGTIGTNYRHGITLSTQNFPKASQPSSTNQASTHFTYLNALTGVFGTYVVTGNYIIIHDKDGLYPDSTSFNSWLASQYSAGTPVSFAYTVETPFTVQLTPQQILSLSQPDPYVPRLNTVYSDQVSVQVGYPKSPQASQTELTNAIVSLGGNV